MKEYEVQINGMTHTVQLSDEDAEQYGKDAKPVTKQAKAPANKSRTADNKE